MRSRTYLVLLCCLSISAGGTSRAQQTAKGKAQSDIDGRLLFSQNCSSCHGSDGRGGERAPNIATQHDVVASSDAQLEGVVSNGIPEAGMPAFDDLGNEKVNALVSYLRVLQGVGDTAHAQAPGNPMAGEAIFFGKASCSRCHMVHGRGGFIAEDLSDFGRGRPVDAIRAAIVDPKANPRGGGELTTIMTSDGTKFQGVIRAQDNFTVALQGTDGVFHSISRDRIAELDNSAHPLMPQDYGTTLDPRELDDVVSYLMKSATPIAPRRVSESDKGKE